MTDVDSGLKDIADIRSMMERSSKFLSLSGLAGVSAGITALAGAGWANWYIAGMGDSAVTHRDVLNMMLGSAIVLVLALGSAMFFSRRLATRKGWPLWNGIARQTIAALLVPLASGGVFCLILVRQSLYGLIPSTMLLFYGLALFNACKYTVSDIRLLGIFEIVLGLVAALFNGVGLWLWAVGFGILHVVYGTVMYMKYER